MFTNRCNWCCCCFSCVVVVVVAAAVIVALYAEFKCSVRMYLEKFLTQNRTLLTLDGPWLIVVLWTYLLCLHYNCKLKIKAKGFKRDFPTESKNWNLNIIKWDKMNTNNHLKWYLSWKLTLFPKKCFFFKVKFQHELFCQMTWILSFSSRFPF